jgi:uncharacterized protein (TIGR02646 family)
MRFILKNPEPSSFSTWKKQANADWQPSFNELRKPERPEVIRSLLIEQGYICCYCGQRIGHRSSHIEHLKPQADFPEDRLSYDNFLASCPGYDLEAIQDLKTNPKQEFCGHQRSNWYDANLFVTPLAPDCATYFRYIASGEILPSPDPDREAAAKTTIKRLGLNHSKLNRCRRAALEGIFDDLESLTNADLEILIKAYNQPNFDGQLIPYCAAITYQLQQLLP